MKSEITVQQTFPRLMYNHIDGQIIVIIAIDESTDSGVVLHSDSPYYKIGERVNWFSFKDYSGQITLSN